MQRQRACLANPLCCKEWRRVSLARTKRALKRWRTCTYTFRRTPKCITHTHACTHATTRALVCTHMSFHNTHVCTNELVHTPRVSMTLENPKDFQDSTRPPGQHTPTVKNDTRLPGQQETLETSGSSRRHYNHVNQNGRTQHESSQHAKKSLVYSKFTPTHTEANDNLWVAY